MTQEEIIQYNKRCAEFLGDEGMEIICSDNGFHYPSIDEMKFDSDWNWIMEVVEVIVRIPNNNSSDTTLQTRKRDVQYILMSTQKEAVVGAINQFLIWYEQNK